MLAAVGPHLLQLPAEGGNPPADHPAVGFQLGFPRAPHPYPDRPAGASAGLPDQVAPQPGQAGLEVLVLGELDLDLPLPAVGVEGKDVQDQGAPIQDPDPFSKNPLDIPLLSWGKLVVEYHHPQLRSPGKLLAQLLELALAQVGTRIDFASALDQPPGHAHPCGIRQPGQFVQGAFRGPAASAAGSKPSAEAAFGARATVAVDGYQNRLKLLCGRNGRRIAEAGSHRLQTYNRNSCTREYSCL